MFFGILGGLRRGAAWYRRLSEARRAVFDRGNGRAKVTQPRSEHGAGSSRGVSLCACVGVWALRRCCGCRRLPRRGRAGQNRLLHNTSVIMEHKALLEVCPCAVITEGGTPQVLRAASAACYLVGRQQCRSSLSPYPQHRPRCGRRCCWSRHHQ